MVCNLLLLLGGLNFSNCGCGMIIHQLASLCRRCEFGSFLSCSEVQKFWGNRNFWGYMNSSPPLLESFHLPDEEFL